MGRPSSYTPEVGTAICERLAAGQSLRAICRDEGMPDRGTVVRWLDADPEFRSRYARARELQADALADECLEIADDGTNDYVEVATKGGGTKVVLDTEAVMRSRLRFDARRWFAGKVAPKKYGERVIQEHTGGEKPVEVNARHDVSPQFAAEVGGILAAIGVTVAAPAPRDDRGPGPAQEPVGAPPPAPEAGGAPRS